MFCHLHVHSEYSMLESPVKIESLIDAACSYGMPAVALTDKYVMSGCVDFYKKAKDKGIKPVIGCEICIKSDEKDMLYHLTLLAKDYTGYKNLCRIVSHSHIRPDSGPVPFVRMCELSDVSKGLIALSGCSKGEVASLISYHIKKAELALESYLSVFGDDFYIEVQRYPISSLPYTDKGASEMLIRLAGRKGIPIVATNDVHYLNKKDFIAYRALARLRSMSVKKDPTFSEDKGKENYFKDKRQMEALFKDEPEALSNTVRIATGCRLEIPIGIRRIPRYKSDSNTEDNENYLERICQKGLVDRYGQNIPEKASKRLDKELGIIKKTGFVDYFLIVAEIATFAYRNNIPLCGKGSAAGSLVSYVLRISSVDPIKNDLYFERFLNEERKSLPDIDIDISNRDRKKVIDYLSSKYGKYKIARVSTFSTTKPRASIREASRLLGMAKEDADHLIKSVPGYNRFLSPRDMKARIKDSGMGILPESPYDKVLRLSEKISGYVRHASMHPSAIIVSDTDFYDIVPLTLSETGEIMSQYDKESIESLGIMKIDLINSLSLCLISDVAENLASERDIKISMDDIDNDDSKVYRMIAEGRTLGVFQLESFGIRTLARKVRPSDLNDITLLISLYRPGPQQSGMVKNFIERKFGREKTTFMHTDLKPLLADTFGIILYQEQVMKIALKIAGYSLSEADTLRKAMTRLSKQQMQAQGSRFLQGALKKGYSREIAIKVFTLISKFVSYGFVKAHAAAYAELSYKTCYFKRYYPAEFFAAILSNGSGYYPKMQYIEEARRYGVRIKSPDINKSDSLRFTVEDSGRSIRVPLISVKNLGFSVSKTITEDRGKNGFFLDLPDFYYRTKGSGISSRVITNMIKTGAFDFTGSKRKYLVFYFESLATGKYQRPLSLLPQTCERHVADFSEKERLEMESEILGFCIEAHPLSYFKDELAPYKVTKSSELYRMPEGARIFSAGFVLSRRHEKTRSGKRMLFCTMEDQEGMYEVVCFPELYEKMIKTITADSSLLIEARLGFKDNNVSLVVKDVKSLRNLKRKTRKKEVLKLRDLIITSSTSKDLWKRQER